MLVASPAGAAAHGARKLVEDGKHLEAQPAPVTAHGILDCSFSLTDDFLAGVGGYAIKKIGETIGFPNLICVYGNYCGAGCTGASDGSDAVDDVDTACAAHDGCFLGNSNTSCTNCECNRGLKAAMEEIIAADDSGCGCKPFQTTCSERISAAKHVRLYAAWAVGKTCGACDSSSDSFTSTTDSANTSPSPSGVAGCSTNVSSDTDLLGGDLVDDAYYSVSDAAECCQMCQDDAGCGAWSYSPDNSACDGPCCFLKGGSGWTISPSPGMVSGWF
ncbi:hypothetical protein ABPG75_008169 [Micractinium tetrahymenae]